MGTLNEGKERKMLENCDIKKLRKNDNQGDYLDSIATVRYDFLDKRLKAYNSRCLQHLTSLFGL